MANSKMIEYDNKKWFKQENENYYKHHTTYLHRYIWEKYNGKIKKGYHIHHKDGNFENNDITNLIEVSPYEHAQLHQSEERKQKAREWANQIRPLTKEWHKSEEGKKWHRQHAQRFNFGHISYGKATCEVCGKVFVKKQDFQKFCSNACKSKYRRQQGLDNIIKKCAYCGKDFETSKYKTNKFCSRSCFQKSIMKTKE